MHGQAGAAATEGCGDPVVQPEGGTADDDPGVLQQALRNPPGKYIRRRQADPALGLLDPRNADIAGRVERDTATHQRDTGQLPVGAESATSSLEAEATGALPVRLQKRGDEQCRVGFAARANQRGLEPYNTVVAYLGRDVPGGDVAKDSGIGDVPSGNRYARRARCPLERKGRHTAFGMRSIIEGENLRQDNLVSAEAR
jgi:hypothetical protein